MKVNGDSLSSICKLIFKISKDPEHDELFKAEGLIGEMFRFAFLLELMYAKFIM